MRETEIQREWLPEMVAKYGITDIADIGAGDLNWMAHTELGCGYTPYDLIPRAHGVKQLDLLTDKLPKAHTLMCLWVINHLPPDMQEVAINKLKGSGSKYLIMTYDSRMEPCTDLPYIETTRLKRRDNHNFDIRLIEL